jgi:hypothetical protein
MLIQLSELIPMKTPLGDGYAIVMESGQHDNYWTIALENGALVTFRQQEIRIARSYTHGRGLKHTDMRRVVNKPLPDPYG